jgi:hydroxymethylbilane synthase
MRDNPFRLIVSLNLDRHEILVAGGGKTGERKIGTLLASGAKVRLISPEATERLRALAKSGEIKWESKKVAREDFKGRLFAVLALPQEALVDVMALARAEGCAVDACSDGLSGDFALCAQFEADGCFVGVSSGGGDPAKAAGTKRAIMGICQAERSFNRAISDLGGCGQKLPSKEMTILTRSSPLALIQAGECVDALAGLGIDARCRTVASHGDRDRNRDLADFGGFGAFVKAIEEELLSGGGDLAVHSLKDMPANLPDGCVLASVLPRGPAHDVLITRDGGGLESLAPGAVVGTSSLRRRAQVRGVRDDLRFVTCRGNIETRLGRLRSGNVDALILAEAGLMRLGISLDNAIRLPFITSAGQGAIAIEARAGSDACEIARELCHLDTWNETAAERELLRLMGLGCHCPIGVRGELSGEVMKLSAALYATPVKEERRGECLTLCASGRITSAEDARALASSLWDEMRDLPLMAELMSLDLKR